MVKFNLLFLSAGLLFLNKFVLGSQPNFPDTLNTFGSFEIDNNVGSVINNREIPSFIFVSNPADISYKVSDEHVVSGNKSVLLEFDAFNSSSDADSWQVRQEINWEKDTLAMKVPPGEFISATFNVYPTDNMYIYARPELSGGSAYSAKSEVTLIAKEWNKFNYLIYNERPDTVDWLFKAEWYFPANNALNTPLKVWIDDVYVSRSKIFDPTIAETGDTITIDLGVGTTLNGADSFVLPSASFDVKAYKSDGSLNYNVNIVDANIEKLDNQLSRLKLTLDTAIYKDVAYVTCDYDTTGAQMEATRKPGYVSSFEGEYIHYDYHPGWENEFINNHSLVDRPTTLPEGGIACLADPITNYAFGGGSGTQDQVIEIIDMPFNKAIEATVVSQPIKITDYQLKFTEIEPVSQEDAMLLTFYARSLESTDETGTGYVQIVVEKFGDPWTKSLIQEVSIGSGWRQYFIPFSMLESYGIDEYRVAFQMGYPPQTVQFADVQLYNYKNKPLAELPQTSIYYVGMEDTASWRQKAAQRIENIRKGDIKIEVMDKNGTPIPNASVDLDMREHAYGFGSAISSSVFFSDQQYMDTVFSFFNEVTLENDLKWRGWINSIRRNRAIHAVDTLVSRGIEVRGHAIIWPSYKNSPDYLLDFQDDPESLATEIDDHFKDIVPTMKGKLIDWDVINEPVNTRTFMDLIGDSVMAHWYKLTDQLDPKVNMFVNDHSIVSGGGLLQQRLNRYHYIIDTIQKGCNNCLDGIGVQGHFDENLTSMYRVKALLDTFATYNVPIKITEFDIYPGEGQEEVQKKYLIDFFTMFFSHPATESIILWGFKEDVHWRPNAALYDKNWNIRPHGQAWKDLVFNQWWTTESGISNDQGEFSTRGFLGTFEYTVKTDKDTITGTFELTSNTALKNVQVVSSVNKAPTDISINNNSVNEAYPPGTLVGLLNTVDPDVVDSHTYSLEPDVLDNNLFKISGNELQTNEVLDFETKDSYTVRVITDDGFGGTFEKDIFVSVTDIRSIQMNGVYLDNDVLFENEPEESTVGLLNTAGEGLSSTFTYNFASGAGDNNNDLFSIVDNQLKTAQTFNYEEDSIYSIRVIASDDPNNLTKEENISIKIRNVNEAPTNITLSNNVINENNKKNDLIGALYTDDPDYVDTFSYQMVAGNGDADNPSFTLENGQLLTNEKFNYEIKNSYSIRVQTKDGNSSTFEKVFEILINNIAESPTGITIDNNSIAENAPIGTMVGLLSTSDPDMDEKYTYFFIQGIGDTDNSSFSLQGDTLKTSGVFDFESKSFYSIRIQTIDDNGGTYEEEFSIFILNKSEPPTDIILDNQSIHENNAIGDVIGSFTTMDEDVGENHTYKLITENGEFDNESFVINGNKLQAAEIFDFESKSMYSINIQTNDNNGGVFHKTYTITIIDEDDFTSSIRREMLDMFILPNPANNKVMVIHGKMINHLYLLNMDGKILRQIKTETDDQTIINIHDLKKGVYIIKTDKGNVCKLLIN